MLKIFMNPVLIFAAIVFTTGQGFGQLPPIDPADLLSPDPDFVAVGGPERIDGENGTFKLIYRNKRKLIFREEEYEVTGSMVAAKRKMRTKDIVGFFPDGSPRGYQLTEFGEDPNTIDARKDGPTIRHETMSYDAKGNPVERKVYDSKPFTIDKVKVTTWPEGSGPKGVTVTKKFNRALSRFEIVKESPYEGKWRLESNGAKRSGEFAFVDIGALLEIRRDSRLWWLTLDSTGNERTVMRPASSTENLGLTGRLVQLRGDPGAGRLEIWATPDLQSGSDYSATGFALVKEEN